MKSTTLMNALCYYLQSADCQAAGDFEDTMLSVKQLAAVQERSTDADVWKDEVFVVTAWTMDNVLNFMTYDTYGKLAKAALPDKIPFSCYANNCRKMFGFDDLTDDALMLGYEIIGDLWKDNEAEGLHNPDGSIATAQEAAIDLLIETAKACLLINECLLTGKARTNIEEAISTLTK